MSTNTVSAASVESVLLSEITVGARRRQKLGKLAGLQQSIDTLGLVHPILIRGEGELVAGHRRLEACRALGWKKIPARRVDRMSDEDLRAIELDENAKRLDLTTPEQSRRRLAAIVQQEADVRNPVQSEPGKRGPKKSPGSRSSKAKASGASESSIARDEKAVATADRFPFMEQWPQSHVFQGAKLMDELPVDEHPQVAAVVSLVGGDSKNALRMIGGLAEREPERRATIYELAESDDRNKQGEAMALAAKLPPPPPPALLILAGAIAELKRAAKLCEDREVAKEIEALVIVAKEIDKTMDAAYRAKRREWQ